jgi:hypothetical protein
MTGERLAEETDIPSIPEDYHMTIVWWALIRYASHEGAAGHEGREGVRDIAMRRWKRTSSTSRTASGPPLA